MEKKASGLFGAKLSFSNKIKKILGKYGNQKIRAIRIGRRPISSMVEKAFNIISLGKWAENKKNFYYDTLFHLFIILTLDDGTVISFEKNSIVTATENDPRCSLPNVECIELDYLPDSITLDDFFNKPLERIGKKRYFIYSPFEQNCQAFVSLVLNTFGLLTPKVKEFVYQDITELVKNLPFYVRWVGKAVTDIDATIKKVTGAGEKKEPDELEILTHFVTDMLKEI